MGKENETTFKTIVGQDAAGICGPDGCSIIAHRKLTKEAKKKEAKNDD